MRRLTLAELKAAATENLAAHFTWVQRQTAGMDARLDKRLVLTDSGLACDTFNAVCRAQFSATDAPIVIHETMEYFAVRKHPFSWWLSPGDTPDDLVTHLLAAGLLEDYSEAAMAADLTAMPMHQVDAAGLTIQRVRTAAQLADFARIIAVMWSPPDANVTRFYELGAAAILRAGSPMWFYVGYAEGVPVATAELTVGGDVVGLYNICTLPEFRQRGFGTAMTVRPLVDARAAGYETAILQATEAGARVYERLGFETFGMITEYKPPVE